MSEDLGNPKAGQAQRASGILLHPTSLPGPHGIGDLGAEARQFVDFLAASGQRLWQIMPLGPVGYGSSPYATLSAFAGTPLLISLNLLADEGLLAPEELVGAPDLPAGHIDYHAVQGYKLPLLRRAYETFSRSASEVQHSELRMFCARHAGWLDDYALFVALRARFGGKQWNSWNHDIAARQPGALAYWRHELAEDVRFHQFVQYQFFRQWLALRYYANERGIRIIGDIPIFVAMDSSDVWSRRELFFLDDRGHPTVVAGVPPDYFSSTGQLWGNPLYRWEAMAANGYEWWVARFRNSLDLVDLVRIDHFRGFHSYWEVPAEHRTAEHGRWVMGPGESLFRMVERVLGTLPVIAEDLGLITPEVEQLRSDLGFPGMKVLQFAFGEDPTNPYLPHNYDRSFVVYTGTHDNDTTVGWFSSLPGAQQEAVARYLGGDQCEINWMLIRLALASVADMAIVPLQDVLGLGTDSRMNYPGKADGNWTWRYRGDQLKPEYAGRLREMTITYGRLESGAGRKR